MILRSKLRPIGRERADICLAGVPCETLCYNPPVSSLNKGEMMAKKSSAPRARKPNDNSNPTVAATLAGVIYHARLLNRQSKLNISEQEVISDVVHLYRVVRDELAQDE
jgi:hypothetical protein